jgi:hypothetical protein
MSFLQNTKSELARRKLLLALFQLQEEQKLQKKKQHESKMRRLEKKEQADRKRKRVNENHFVDDKQMYFGVDLSPNSPGLTLLDNCNEDGTWSCSMFFLPQAVKDLWDAPHEVQHPAWSIQSESCQLSSSLHVKIQPFEKTVQKNIKKKYPSSSSSSSIAYYKYIARMVYQQIHDLVQDRTQKLETFVDPQPPRKKRKRNDDEVSNPSEERETKKIRIYVGMEQYAMNVDPAQCNRLFQIHETGGMLKMLLDDDHLSCEMIHITENKKKFCGKGLGHATKEEMIEVFHRKHLPTLELYSLFGREKTQKKINPIDDLVDSYSLAVFLFFHHHEV